MRKRQLGKNGPQVGTLGLGCMSMSGMYGPADQDESIATIQAAIDAGVNLLDTADFYEMGHNEMLVGRAIKGRRDEVTLSVKYGALRDPDGGWHGFDGRPASMRNFLVMSLRRLGVDYVDIYRPGRLDPNVSIEEKIGALAEMVGKGYVRHIGLSEVSSATLRRAAAVHPICDLQIEYSLFSRGIESDILETCRELGVGITAYSVLGRGLISGHWKKDLTKKGDVRVNSPRFHAENIDWNLQLVESLRGVAHEKGVSTAQIAIAWVAAQGDDIVPLVGARDRHRLTETLGSLDVSLSVADCSAIEAAVPKGAAAGERYAKHFMARLDSER